MPDCFLVIFRDFGELFGFGTGSAVRGCKTGTDMAWGKEAGVLLTV